MPATAEILPANGRSAHRQPLRKDLRASMGDGSAYSVMVGIGETYLPAFVLAMGMGQLASGLIATVPLLVGSLLQLTAPRVVARLGSHRKWVVLCALTQAASFLPLIVGALFGTMPVWLVFAIASIYWGASLGCGPAWNTWMGSVVPARIRARFFATRSRASQLATLVGFLTGGIVLQAISPTGYVLWAFASLFAVACVCRYASATFLFQVSEPEPPDDNQRRLPLFAVLKGHPNASLLVFLLLMQICVQISGPYFTPFMLEQLHLPYWQYTAIFGIQFAAKLIALPFLGKLAQRIGADRLLWAMSVGVIPLAALWIVSGNFYFLLLIQAAAGVFWGGYELAFLLLFFETIPRRDRTSLLTNYNVAHSTAIVVGSLMGFVLLYELGRTPTAYYTLFGLSSVLRACVVTFLVWIPIVRLKAKPMAVRSIGMRATDTSLDEPVLSSIVEDSPVSGKRNANPETRS